MMDEMLEMYVEEYLREKVNAFSVKTLKNHLAKKGFYTFPDHFDSYIESHPNVFKVSKKQYLTRAGCFTGRYFGIKPSQYEIDNGILIPGDRCMPFVDPGMMPDELEFFFEQNHIEYITATVPLRELMDHYSLYGEEYSAQYIAMDPCNADENYAAKDFVLPSVMNCTVLDLSDLYARWGFKYGDWLRACVVDWSSGFIVIEPRCEQKVNLFEETKSEEERKLWNRHFEDVLSESFGMYGPCNGIMEQLSYAFVDNMMLLTGPDCGCVEEYLKQSDKIGFAEYGVESRLWLKNTEIPATGNWAVESNDAAVVAGSLYEVFNLPMPEFMLEAYVKDSLYLKEPDSAEILSRIVRSPGYLSKWQESILLIRLHRQRQVINCSYNWFADHEIGAVRHKALVLYSDILELVCKLDRCGYPVQKMPQRELVILSQLFGHTAKLISGLLYQKDISDKELDSSSLSLEGMEYSLEDIKPALTAVFKK